MARCARVGLALVVVFWAAAAAAVDIDVSNGGTDTASCGVMPNGACKTIGFAVGARASAAPDRVLVMDGTYDTAHSEIFPIELKDGVSIIGNTSMPGNVIVDGRGGISFPDEAIFVADGPLSSDTVISGLTMMLDTLTDSFSHIVVTDFGVSDDISPMIEHNRFIGGSTGVDIHVSVSNSSDVTTYFNKVDPTIRNNFFSGLAFAGVHVYDNVPGNLQMIIPAISDNTIVDLAESADAIHVEIELLGAGLVQPTIHHNTITNPAADAIDVSADDLFNTLFGTSLFDQQLTIMPMITDNTITNVGVNGGGDGIEVDVGSLEASTGEYALTVAPTVTGNTVTTASGDGIDVSVFSLTADEGSPTIDLSFNALVTGNTVSGAQESGMEIEVTDIDGVLELTYKATVSGNTLSGNGEHGLFFNIDDWSSVTSVDIQTVAISGNTALSNGLAGIRVQAVDVNSSASGFDFSPTIRGNLLQGNMGAGSGLDMAFGDTGVAGTAMVSSNTITNNNGSGVHLDFGPNCDECDTPLNGFVGVVLRGNTITGNGGDAVFIGGTGTGSSTTPATGNYAVDLGGGFVGGDGLNIIQGNVAMPATSGVAQLSGPAMGTCVGGGFCDINNNGPVDVAAECNQFSADNVTDEEDFLNDQDDDAQRGDVDPISICTAVPTEMPTEMPTETPTGTPTSTPTFTPSPAIMSPEITSDPEAGDTQVCGKARPDLADGCLELYRVDGMGNMLLGSSGSDAQGMFCIDVMPPLTGGENLFVQDICDPFGPDDPLVGPRAVAVAFAPVPALSGLALLLAMLTLAGASFLALRRRAR